ncbi:hypothetical protein GQ457_13G014990 [Hibiscus cannabinus]
MTYAKIYSQLFKADLLRPYYLTPMQPSYLSWYDPIAHCDYHAGVAGYLTENCFAFKKFVQNLINNGVVKFDEPSVAANHLPLRLLSKVTYQKNTKDEIKFY